MRLFERHGAVIETDMDADEVDLIATMVGSLIDLLGGREDAAGADDPLAWLASGQEALQRLDRDDPAIARLFPDAYAHDPDASAEFRRFRGDDARRVKVDAALRVLADLDATKHGALLLRIAPEGVQAWITTLNNLRLVLAARLGIDTEADWDAIDALPPDDPREYQVAVYEWLGGVLESLLEALTA